MQHAVVAVEDAGVAGKGGDGAVALRHQIHELAQDDANASLLLNWMGHMLRHPTVKPQKGIVLVGPPCCGKSLFFRLLALLTSFGDFA